MSINPGIFAGAITAAATHSQRVNSIGHNDIKIVNKNIVYKDTVLPLKELGENIKITSISNVGKYSLDRCLKIIFDSNPNVIFNTIQYSQKNNKIYFYANDVISTKEWEESNIRTYKPITKSSEILEEVKNILIDEPNKNNDCISLYHVAQLMKKKNKEIRRIKNYYEEYFDSVIKSEYGGSSTIIVHDFDFDEEELNISFKYYKHYYKIIFAKNNGDLYLKRTESYRGKDILVLLGGKLSELYDKFIEYKEFYHQNSYKINSVNSNFLVKISRHGVGICVISPSSYFINEFELDSYSFENGYHYDCNSTAVISAFKGKENEIFKRIFVRIEDCPEWSQPVLYEIRQNQLEEEKRIEEEKLLEQRKIEEESKKRQKRLEFRNKIFPFLKKK